jgi:hypothetical protein
VSERAIDRIVAHWHKTKAKREKIDTAWGFAVWWSAWTLEEQDSVLGPAGAFGADFSPQHFAKIVVVKAEDEAGNRMFADGDLRELLTEAIPGEVKRVGTAILAALNATNKAASDRPDDNAPKP